MVVSVVAAVASAGAVDSTVVAVVGAAVVAGAGADAAAGSLSGIHPCVKNRRASRWDAFAKL